MSLLYAVQLTVNTAQFGVRQCADVEKFMTSVERVISYTQMEAEPGYHTSVQPPENWPQSGNVQVKNLCLSYYQDAPQVLKDVSFNVNPSESIGIVGRTGAGKSSLVSALFRMPEPTGHIVVDGVDIQSINLQRSRKAISVIAQDPILFTGTLRTNLDPFEKFTDREVWDSLEKAGLESMVKKLPNQLESEIRNCGANFSSGERQLVCLARAFLQRNKIIILDEATANVDLKTDRVIQETIQRKFQDCTILTIAHRLNNILDYDRVLVFQDGHAVEFDKPGVLLEKDGGHFAKLYEIYSSN